MRSLKRYNPYEDAALKQITAAASKCELLFSNKEPLVGRIPAHGTGAQAARHSALYFGFVHDPVLLRGRSETL